MDSVQRTGPDRVEQWAYAIAVVVLVVAGALLRSLVLNWIVGPMLVVLVVAGVYAWAERREEQP